MRRKALLPVVLVLLVLGWIQARHEGQNTVEKSNHSEGSHLSSAEHDRALQSFPFRAEITAENTSSSDELHPRKNEAVPAKI
ncbi:hypothetical protein FCL40_17830 [Ferrimonas sediminicola]|uniref:Uncharacterized protein n=1 Tax=Ferrimonas sediminicola TaxID=2569538 RepID=A0A4U1B7J8_9GAMM|nr:hypothetical protein [Ferrimonas sediminicola]TKB46455.1 hypothetical protein FCL40_17830 [Ferrimonas sediminicola]